MSVYPTSTAIQMALSTFYADVVKANFPVTYMRLGERTGSIAYDSSRNQYVGTYVGGVTLGTNNPLIGDGDTGVTFDGISGCMNLVNIPAPAGTGGVVTVTGWFRWSSSITLEYILDQSDASGYGWRMYIDHDKFNFVVQSLSPFGSASVASVSTYNDNVFHFVAGVCDGSSLKLYIDGALVATTASTKVPDNDGVTHFTIGQRTAHPFYGGDVDEVAIYATALTAAQILAQFNAAGGAWTNVATDVLIDTPIQCSYGIQGSDPTNRVAGTGTLTFALNNSVSNSGGLLGYYSPDNANCRSGFALGTMVRYLVTYGGVTYYKFIGTIDEITPTTGLHGDRITLVTACDWMDEAANTTLNNVAVQLNVRSDQVFSYLLNNCTRLPAAQSIGTGLDTYPFALDTARVDQIALLEEFQKLAMSEVGFVYVKGDTTQGGTLVFESRTDRAGKSVALSTFSNTMMDVSVKRGRSTIITRVQAVVHPRTVDAAATTVLFNLPTGVSQISLGAGESRTIVCLYTDPTLRASRVAATAQVTPVATTDYLFNSASDGSGSNLTGSLTVEVTLGSDSTTVVLTNTGTVTGYVIKLQLRGKGLYDYQPVIATQQSTSAQLTYGLRTMNYDMPYQSDPNVVNGAATYFLAQYVSPVSQCDNLVVDANASAALMTACLAREPGDCIAFQETVSGLTTATLFFIQNVSIEQGGRGNIRVAFGLVRASLSQFWLLGVVGASELDSTTTLGF